MFYLLISLDLQFLGARQVALITGDSVHHRCAVLVGEKPPAYKQTFGCASEVKIALKTVINFPRT